MQSRSIELTGNEMKRTLLEVCNMCQGDKQSSCYYCKGTGLQPTEAGYILIGFLKDYSNFIVNYRE